MATTWAKIRSKFRRTLQRFVRAREGNVAVIFALATLPIIASVGAAVDYSRANAVKADMQAALNSTALMLSKEAANDTVDQLQAKASTYFTAIFNPHGAENIAVSASYDTTNGSTLVLNGSVDVPTDFMQAFGYDTVTLRGSSTARWGTNRLRVALVLDNTGSMASSGKMDALKTATTNMLSQLKSAVTTTGDVYVSIVPFVKDVNLGAANYQSNWIDWTEWDAANGSCSGYSNYPYWGSPRSKSSCLTYNGTWTPKDHQYLERLRRRPRRQQRAGYRRLRHQRHRPHHQHHRHALRRRAVFVLPAGGHGPELRLDRDEHAGVQHDSRPATPIRRSACSSAG